MPAFIVDITLTDRDVPTAKAQALVDAMLERYEGSSAETWRAGGLRFWRVLLFKEAPAAREVMRRIYEQGGDLFERLGIGATESPMVSYAVRNATYSVMETLPPEARRMIVGGRPPKNPPPGV